MNSLIKGLVIVTVSVTIFGCAPKGSVNSAIDENGRPVAPSGQSVTGGPPGVGPVGQPQS